MSTSPTQPACEAIAKLPDGFYWFKGDSESPNEWGVIHRLEGKSWGVGHSRPVRDDEWEDQIKFYPAIPPITP